MLNIINTVEKTGEDDLGLGSSINISVSPEKHTISCDIC